MPKDLLVLSLHCQNKVFPPRSFLNLCCCFFYVCAFAHASTNLWQMTRAGKSKSPIKDTQSQAKGRMIPSSIPLYHTFIPPTCSVYLSSHRVLARVSPVPSFGSCFSRFLRLWSLFLIHFICLCWLLACCQCTPGIHWSNIFTISWD